MADKEAASLSECEWESVKPLFDGLKREKFNIGKATLEFYDERDPGLLSEEERDYLERLVARKTTESDDEDENFYRDYRLELKEGPSLKARWDRFIYGAPVETDDLISGLAQCLQALFDQDQSSSERKLRISSDKRNPKDLKDLNCDAGLYFAFRYKGLKELLGRSVTWDIGQLFNFAELDRTWRSSSKPYRNRSVARLALQVKFYLDLEVKLSNGTTESYSKQLIWQFDPSAISSQLYDDWNRLVENPLVLCRANRELLSGKGRIQSIDLKDVRTLLPTYDKERGSLVAVYRKESDIERFWPDRVKEAANHQRIDQVTADDLIKLFKTFVETYAKAINEFWKFGLGNTSILIDQLKAYSDLLIAICRKAKGDRNREMLLRPLLEIGAVPVDGGPVAAITAPWHPFRLAAMANKSLRVTSLIRYLVTAENVFFGDTKLYFGELKAELAHPYYPEVILGWKETKPELLSLSDRYLDYSLHEPPVMEPQIFADTNENPNESALLVIDILKRYLTLHPHERANLSVVLYNCDSARLPHAIVDKIQEIYENEEDMRCQVILRHRNRIKLRELYERIIESGSDIDSFIASEATRDFMARLRIGIMADEAPTPQEADGAPNDVIFLQDVIARHAKLEWYHENAQPIRLEEWVPPRWSRRRPAASDDMKSIVYLSCPVASIEGWNYLTGITTFLKGDWDGLENQRLLPARQLNFNDPTTAAIFKEVHNLGKWVVNYDELLDRRQLMNQNVKVIRYKQTDTQGRNTLISTTSSMTLLHRMVLQRIKNLTLGLEELELSNLAQRMIDDANLVSGDIVLRAAKHGRNASELMGIVLSRYLIQNELPGNRNFGWYFLDDYADWLGQKEGRIADILALSPETDRNGNKRLAIIISESKYIDYGSLSDKRKESQKQLRDTVIRIDEAIFGDPERLDRDLWLSRFSDLMLDGIRYPANWPIDLHSWRRAVREGECNIYMRGYSHIFVSGPSDSPECSDFVAVAGTDKSWQEVFSRARLRELVLAYAKRTDPIEIRKSISGENMWEKQLYRKPSGLIQIVKAKSENDKTSKEEKEGSDQASVSSPSTSSKTEPPSVTQPNMPITVNLSKNSNAWSYHQIGQVISGYQGGSKDSVDDQEWLRQMEKQMQGCPTAISTSIKIANEDANSKCCTFKISRQC